jgi:peptidoglycan/xylan/chitin deacetylase (PgdA/CDA1 family)
VHVRAWDRYQILLYHQVTDERDPYFPGVPTETFRRQMRVLSRHFAVLPLGELAERGERSDLPPGALGITFDDGYRDNCTNAFPVLSELGLPATVFLSTGPLEGAGPLWHDRVFSAFRRTAARQLEWDGAAWPLQSVAERIRAMHRVLEGLRRSAAGERDRRIERLVDRLETGEPRSTNETMLSWEQVREMAEGGIDFGAHTVSHPILTAVAPADAEREIVESKATIERRTGRPVTAFAYPNGRPEDFDDAVRRIVRDAGFRLAVTTVGGVNDSGTDPFELRRVQAWESVPEVTALRLALERARGR